MEDFHDKNKERTKVRKYKEIEAITKRKKNVKEYPSTSTAKLNNQFDLGYVSIMGGTGSRKKKSRWWHIRYCRNSTSVKTYTVDVGGQFRSVKCY